MNDSRFHASPSLDSFLAAILDKPDRASAAAFAVGVLDEGGSTQEGGTGATGRSHEDWLDAILYGVHERSDAFGSDILREYDPNEPRDEKGRWTTGGSNDSATKADAPSRKIEQKDLDAMVDKLKKSEEGKAFFDKAEKAAKDAGADGLTIKVEPEENLPNDSEAASNPKTGGIGIRDDVSDAKMLEDLLVELGNITRSKEFNDLMTSGVKKMTRDAYIEAMEKLEFAAMQDTARLWKATAKDCDQDPSKCPTYGNPDDVLKLDFKTHFKQLSEKHKEFYGKQWDAAHQ
ncbi:MAG: hypothetical protein ACLQLG_12590 [Thermoguttaceae bacterium]